MSASTIFPEAAQLEPVKWNVYISGEYVGEVSVVSAYEARMRAASAFGIDDPIDVFVRLA